MDPIQLSYTYSGFHKDDIFNTAKTLLPYVEYVRSVSNKNIYDGKETSVSLPFDGVVHNEVLELVERKMTSSLKYVIVVGIGGSNLGSLAVYDAVYGKRNLYTRRPDIIFVDTISPFLHKEMKMLLKKEVTSSDEILINLISKSGTTTETITNFEYIMSYLGDLEGIEERVVVTTEEHSKLWDEAEKKGYSLLKHSNVGGRFSVMSSVGQFPLLMTRVNVTALLSGARDIVRHCTDTHIEKNISLLSASIMYLHYKNGIHINDSFFFNEEMESIGKWYRQLVGESIGKEKDVDGNEIRTGILPTVSIGSTDLHSVAQLYFGGPKTILFNLVYARQQRYRVEMPQKLLFENLLPDIENKNMADIMDAIYGGVKAALQKKKIPYIEIEMNNISEYTVGQYLQFKMLEIMYLGKLLNINVFNQPNVEDYKKETRALLKK